MNTVYFFNGFLEAGKTTFIMELMQRDYFRIKGKTLIISCEEGDVEYDDKFLRKTNSVVEYIEDEEDFNEDVISEIEKRHRPKRVIVEYNGMWDRKNIHFPWYWDDIAEVAVFDASTFKLYSDNMRSILAEHVRHAGIVMFNRADAVRDKLAGYARNIKAINSGAACIFRGKDGDITLSPDENLPYDIDDEELYLDDEGFFVFCMDALERYEVYAGKKIHFYARAYEMKDGEEFEFVAGRYVMTCCAADMTFIGFICSYYQARQLKNKQWIKAEGIVKVAYDEELKKNVPICRITELEPVEPPEDEIISLI